LEVFALGLSSLSRMVQESITAPQLAKAPIAPP